MYTIKVMSKSTSKPVEWAEVAVSDDRFFSQGVSKSQRTDSNGEAHFDKEPHQGKVFVNGRNEHEGYLSGVVPVYVD